MTVSFAAKKVNEHDAIADYGIYLDVVGSYSKCSADHRSSHNVASLEELIGTAIISGGWDGHMQKQFGKTKARARCFPVEAPRT